MREKVVILLAGNLALGIAGFPQGTKGPAPAPAPAATAGPARTPPGVYQDPNKEFFTEDYIKALRASRPGSFLSGSVQLEGGPLPWEPVPISVTCDGSVRYTTKVDPKGLFLIAPVETRGTQRTADNGSPFATQFVGCSITADLAGFRSSQLLIAKSNVMENPNVGTVTIWREAGAGDSALSITSSSVPQDATKLFERARKEWLAQNKDRAQKDLREAVRIYPQFAEAWYQLGKMQESFQFPEAWNSFSKAAQADAEFELPLEHLASLAAAEEKWQELADICSRGLKLNPPGTLDMWYNNALASYHLKKWDVAEVSVVKSLAMDPLHLQPNSEQLLGVILAEKGDYQSALQHLRKFLTYSASRSNAKIVKRQIAHIEKIMNHPK